MHTIGPCVYSGATLIRTPLWRKSVLTSEVYSFQKSLIGATAHDSFLSQKLNEPLRSRPDMLGSMSLQSLDLMHTSTY